MHLARAGCVRTHGRQSLGFAQAKAIETHLRVHSSVPKTRSSWESIHPLAGSTSKTHSKLNFCQTYQERITAKSDKLKSLEDLDTQATQLGLRHTLGEWSRQ